MDAVSDDLNITNIFLFSFEFFSSIQVDTNGNNVLHLLVIHKLPKMYTKFKQRWIEIQAEKNESSDEEEDGDDNADGTSSKKSQVVPLWKRLNKDGFTPLTLAAQLGESEMFSFLLEERKITQWSYGPVSCVLYPLEQVDLDFQDENEVNR